MANPSEASAGQSFPTGTVTFLFTDIEGSTQLWEDHPQAMKSALAVHDSVLRDAIRENRGALIKMTGDGAHAAFETALDAVNAALYAQYSLHTSQFLEGLALTLPVRMGLHTGEAELRDGDYYGQSLNRAARIMSAAHGGQVLLSSITAELVREHLPADLSLQDLGGHHLKDLVRPEHLYQLNAAGLPQNFPAIQSHTQFPNNLPAQLTSFIGREKEMAEIKELLGSARLVTLTGSGGTGKTRLAIELGTTERTTFASGVWLIELAPLTDPSQIIPCIAQAFDLHEHPFGPLQTLVLDYLRDKKLLLIFDNCEHLIEACARTADELLQHCPQLKILASSREALGIAGEVTYQTPSLAVRESTQLFAERARAANPKFDLTESNVSSVAQICSRLDGIPLAIELAAARAKLLSPEQIAARLDDRFRLLVGGSRTALPRQQTLRALIDWSYDLLSEQEKALFRTASVFVGGWTLEALEAVAKDSETLEHLEQLVNKSLVVTEEREKAMRYFMLETIRQYAREKLFESNQAVATRDRHFAYYDYLTESVWNVLQIHNVLLWLDQADDEKENIRAAVEWALENHIEESVRLAANLALIVPFIGSSPGDALALCRAAINRLKALPPVAGDSHVQRQSLLAKALFVLGMVGFSMGNMSVVIQDLQEAIAVSRIAGDKRILGYSLEMYFTATAFISMPTENECAEEGLRIFRDEISDKWGLTMAYQNMARIAESKGDHNEKENYLARLKEIVRETPLSFQSGLFYLGMGHSEKARGNYETAKVYFEEGLNIFKHLRNWGFQLIMTSEIGHVTRLMGKRTEAKRIYEETLRGWQNTGNRGAIANQLECFAFFAITDEEPQRAAKLLGAAESVRAKAQSPMTDIERIEYNDFVARLRSMLNEAEFNKLWAEGRALTMEQAIQFAFDSLAATS